MARYNEILVGRFARAVQKLFSMKGEVPIGSLAGELTVVHAFQSGAENRYLEAWNRYGQASPVVAAVAAQNSAVRLRNPALSNIIAVIEKLTISGVSVADTPFVQLNALGTDLGSAISLTNSRFDPRGQATSGLIATSGNNVATIQGTKWQGNLPIAATIDVIQTDIQEFPLLPGDALDVHTTAVNTTLTVAWFWRERQLEESERT